MSKSEIAWTKSIKVDESELVNTIMDDFSTAESGRSKWLELRKRCREDYYARRKKMSKPYDKFSDITVPVTTIAVEGVKTHIMNVLVPDNPTIAIKATKDSGIEVAKNATDFMWWQLQNKLRIRNRLFNIINNTIIDGTKVAMITWNKREKRWYDKDTDKVQPYYVEGPKIYCPDLEDIFVPTNALNIQDASFIIRRFYMPPNVVKAKQKQGIYNADIDIESLTPDFEKSEVVRQERLVVGLDDVNTNYDGLEILEWFGNYDLNDDGIEEECYALLLKQSGKLLRLKYLNEVSPSNKRPFAVFKYIEISNVFYGIGLPFFMKTLQEQIDIIYNLRNTSGMLASIPIFGYRPAIGLKPNFLEIEPGLGIPLDNPREDLNFYSIPFNSSWGMVEEQNINQYIQRLTGIDDLALGQQPSRVGATRTYGGLVSLMSKSAQRLSGGVINLQDGFLDMFEQLYELNCAVLPPNYPYRVLGANGKDIFKTISTNADLRQTLETGEFDFVVTASPENTNTNLQRELSQMLYQLLIANPLIYKNPKAVHKLTENLIKKFKVFDSEEILPAIPEDMMRDEISPDKENEIMMQGRYVSPLPQENHSKHILVHNILISSDMAQLLTDSIIEMVQHHIQEHKILLSNAMIQKPGNIPNVRTESMGSMMASQGVPKNNALDTINQGQDAIQNLLNVGNPGGVNIKY